MRLLPLTLLLLVLLAGPLRAEDEPAAEAALRARVVAAIEDLRSADYAVREAARARLQAEGLQAQDLLEAARDDEDAEVRRTVRAILDRAPTRVTPRAAHVAPGDFRHLGTITLEARATPLAGVLAQVGKPVWARVAVPEALARTPVDVSLDGVPFYEAVARVLAPHGLALREPFDALGSATVESVPEGITPAPSAAAGPMRVRVTEVSATRALGTDAPDKYALALELAWAPSVQVAQVETPKIEVARDPHGRPYRPTPAMSRTTTYGIGTTRRHHVLHVHVMPGAEDCETTLAALEVLVVMTLRYDPVQVAFDASEALPRTKDGVTLHGIEEVDADRGQYVVDFSAKLPDDVADRSLTASIVEADGRLSTLGVYGGRTRAADGTVRIRARAYRGQQGPPPGIRIAWHRREERGSLRFRLEDIPLR